jgi:hypothetical protein
MSLVPIEGSDDQAKQDAKKHVYRVWLDHEQAERLLQGKYFATIVRRERSCWIRGDLSDDTLFLWTIRTHLRTKEPVPDPSITKRLGFLHFTAMPMIASR